MFNLKANQATGKVKLFTNLFMNNDAKFQNKSLTN